MSLHESCKLRKKSAALDVMQEHAITSDDALALEDLPDLKTVVTVGAGYISLEFASIFHGMGLETHVMCRKKRLLRGCA